MPCIKDIDRGHHAVCACFKWRRHIPVPGEQEGSFHGPGHPCTQGGRCFTVGTQSKLPVQVLRGQYLKALVRSEVLLHDMASALSFALFVQVKRWCISRGTSLVGLSNLP